MQTLLITVYHNHHNIFIFLMIFLLDNLIEEGRKFKQISVEVLLKRLSEISDS